MYKRKARKAFQVKETGYRTEEERGLGFLPGHKKRPMRLNIRSKTQETETR